MANAGRLRTVAAITAVFIAACASVTPPAGSSSNRSPTRAASVHSRATRESAASEPFAKTISRTFDDGFTRTASPSTLPLPLAALARATSKDLTKTIYLTFDDGPNLT